MPGTRPKKAAPIPADASSGHAARDSHHSGQIQAITTAAVSRTKRAGISHHPAAASAGCGVRKAQQKGETNKAPSGRAANQIKRQQDRRSQRPRRQSHPLQRADTGDNDGRPVSPTVKRLSTPAPGRQLQRNADRHGPKRQSKSNTQRPCRQGHPLQWAGSDNDDRRQTSRVEEAGNLQHQPIPGLDPYIGYRNPASLVPVR